MRLSCLFIVLFATALPVKAAEMPTPPSHPVKEVEGQLQAEKKAEAQLGQKMKGLKTEIEDTQGTLVSVARDIKKNENRLIELEQRLEKLSAEKDDIQSRLAADKDSMGDLVLALQRIERVPPEAILARPGAPLETAQSAMLLESILPDLYGRAENLKGDLARLADIITQLEDDRAEATEAAATLQLKQDDMAALLKKRETLYAQTETDRKERQAAIKKISAKAADLKELMQQLEEKNRQQAQKAAASAAAPRLDRVPLPKTGSAQMPVSGIVRVRYGQLDDIGAKSEGVQIESRAGALVTAPMGGVIRYAGAFRQYGQMVIIEHEKDFHSLVAGMAKIDTVVGRAVAAGEPLGTLGKSGGKPTLYYELRHNGRSVNPAQKLPELE